MFFKPNIKKWADKTRLAEPERVNLFRLIKPGEQDQLEAFAVFCHDLVLDRDVEFTLQKRLDLYRRWLATGQPCFVARHDGSGHIIAASIVLSLTEDAYREYWDEGALDAIMINAGHLLKSTDRPGKQFLLIDVVARNKFYINSVVRKEHRQSLHGVGFRTALYHLNLCAQRLPGEAPTIMCGTLRSDLIRLLRTVGFAERVGEGDLRAPIFDLDLAHPRRASPEGQWLVAQTLQTMQAY